jgi:hypothetical protein
VSVGVTVVNVGAMVAEAIGVAVTVGEEVAVGDGVTVDD